MQYKLFANCVPVRGANRGIICDLQRRTYVFVPNSLIALFNSESILDIDLVNSELDVESIDVFEEYVTMLKSQEFIFEITDSDKKLFPGLDLSWDFPAQISNMIIDIKEYLPYDFNLLVKQIEEVNCRYLQIRSFELIQFETLKHIVDSINGSLIRAIDIVIPDVGNILIMTEILDWVARNKKIRTLTFHSSATTQLLAEASHGFGTVMSITERITSVTHCGNIHPTYFSPSIETFTEAQSHNSCLNRKLAIDPEGNIKNCPSLPETFGNIAHTRLLDVAMSGAVMRYWSISKDSIKICRDCEFRYICIDCRAYLDDPNDIHSKPLKCGYNPYNSKWENWSTNPLKEQAIHHYNMQELVS